MAAVSTKIMHPAEDASLEELRARQPKYQARVAAALAAVAAAPKNHSPSLNNGGGGSGGGNGSVGSAASSMPSTPPPPSLSGISPTGSAAAANAIAVSTAISKAQEVSSYHSYRNHSQYK